MSNLSQFFGTTSGTSEVTASSVMQVFSKSGCLTIPCQACYVTYSALGGGGYGCIVSCGPNPATPPSFAPNGGAEQFCGAGGGGGGFSYKEQPLSLSGELTACLVVGAGGTAPSGQGGCSCVQDITPITCLSCLSALGGQVCFQGTQGGSASGGDINSCGGGVCGFLTGSDSNPQAGCPTCVTTTVNIDSRKGARYTFSDSDMFSPQASGIPQSGSHFGNVPSAAPGMFSRQYYCTGGGGAGNIFGPGHNAHGPFAGGMGPRGGTSGRSPVLSGKNGKIKVDQADVRICCSGPTSCSHEMSFRNSVEIERAEFQYYAQFTSSGQFSQNKTLFSASGGAGIGTLDNLASSICCISPNPGFCIDGRAHRGTKRGSEFFYSIPGVAGGQGGGRGTGGFGGGGGEIGGNGGCGGGGGASIVMQEWSPTAGRCCFFQNGCGGNGVAAVEYWLDV